eukprot:scaffold2009_cov370-Prasinococcus_capsulatus_cf.AAC.10
MMGQPERDLQHVGGVSKGTTLQVALAGGGDSRRSTPRTRRPQEVPRAAEMCERSTGRQPLAGQRRTGEPAPRPASSRGGGWRPLCTPDALPWLELGVCALHPQTCSTRGVDLQ